MTKTQIIGAIMLATGKQVEEVAKYYGYSKYAFYRVINNSSKSKKIRTLISSTVNRPVDEIWPPEKEQQDDPTNHPARRSTDHPDRRSSDRPDADCHITPPEKEQHYAES